MIKIEKTEVVGWEAAIRGMRNPLNSWQRSDSDFRIKGQRIEEDGSITVDAWDKYCMEHPLGPNDLKLAMTLAKGGPVHAKYRRMIQVYVDITAPLYWIAELDTYKVGVVRNSCSFMHKGVSKPYTIEDFSVKDERIYKILMPLRKRAHELEYPYETTEFKVYTDHNDRTYRVYKNGLVIREAFDYVDNWGSGRTRHYEEAGATLYQNGSGYYTVKLSGRNGGHILLHRLVAQLWCDKPEGANQVNHIDGNKGNNSAENLEWVTASENMQKAIDTGLCDELGGLHQKYRLWKNWVRVIPIHKRLEFKRDADSGLTYTELAEKWDITPKQANQLRYELNKSEHEDLFQECYVWDKLIEQMNYMRSLYLETKDEQVFQAIRALVPQGYMQKSTFMMNYEVLTNIYHSRKNHRLDEWREFCSWIETLPYSELITGVAVNVAAGDGTGDRDEMA